MLANAAYEVNSWPNFPAANPIQWMMAGLALAGAAFSLGVYLRGRPAPSLALKDGLVAGALFLIFLGCGGGDGGILAQAFSGIVLILSKPARKPLLLALVCYLLACLFTGHPIHRGANFIAPTAPKDSANPAPPSSAAGPPSP
jgi:hypothetical protein